MYIKKSILPIIFILLVGCVQQDPYSISTPTPTITSTSTTTPCETYKPSTIITPTPISTIHPTPVFSELPLNITADPLRPFYLPGEMVEIKLTFKNRGLRLIKVSPFPPEIWIMHSKSYGYPPLLVEKIRSFLPGYEELWLEPGMEATYNLTWDQQDNNGHQVNPSYYFINVPSINLEEAGVGNESIGYQGLTKVLIQFPQGAMEKTIVLNQSQTRENVTITLERLELSILGAKVYVLVKLHNYTPFTPIPEIPITPAPPPPPPIESCFSHAWYKLDNGTWRDIGYGEALKEKDYDNDIKLTWELIDPVPSDAKEMTFVITELIINSRKWVGPWEFRISLN